MLNFSTVFDFYTPLDQHVVPAQSDPVYIAPSTQRPMAEPVDRCQIYFLSVVCAVAIEQRRAVQSIHQEAMRKAEPASGMWAIHEPEIFSEALHRSW